MTPSPDRLALVHGPAELARPVREALAAAGIPVEDVEESAAIEALAAESSALLLVEAACLKGMPAEPLAESRTPSGRQVAVLAFGCADPASVNDALGRGARLALRSDATAEEVAAAARALLEADALRREHAEVREDLDRQAGLVMKDDLTAAYNRRYFERALDEEIDRARRFDSEVSLIFMDIDDLKEINKRYGHSMGSLVLREAAARAIRTIRSIDKVVRYGGDEFCIILPETGPEGARDAAERIRHGFAAAPFVVDATGGLPLTASFGIASFPRHARTKLELIRAADQAMFRIKDTQKDGILLAGPVT